MADCDVHRRPVERSGPTVTEQVADVVEKLDVLERRVDEWFQTVIQKLDVLEARVLDYASQGQFSEASRRA